MLLLANLFMEPHTATEPGFQHCSYIVTAGHGDMSEPGDYDKSVSPDKTIQGVFF